MHHQIGIAANGRGEMGVGAERQAEMPDILRRVIGLGLASEYLFHHLRADVAVADLLQDAVEGRGLDHLAKRKGDVEGLQIILERDQLLAARRLMGAVHHRGLLRLQRLCGGDIRSEEHTSELQSLMRSSYADFCLQKTNNE